MLSKLRRREKGEGGKKEGQRQLQTLSLRPNPANDSVLSRLDSSYLIPTSHPSSERNSSRPREGKGKLKRGTLGELSGQVGHASVFPSSPREPPLPFSRSLVSVEHLLLERQSDPALLVSSWARRARGRPSRRPPPLLISTRPSSPLSFLLSPPPSPHFPPLHHRLSRRPTSSKTSARRMRRRRKGTKVKAS